MGQMDNAWRQAERQLIKQWVHSPVKIIFSDAQCRRQCTTPPVQRVAVLSMWTDFLTIHYNDANY